MIVVPGEFLATEEEFLPGDGTYSENGKIFSSLVGELTKDYAKREVSITPPFKIPRFNVVGSIVYGRVMEVTDQFAVLKLFPYYTSRFKLVPPFPFAAIHISKLRKGFVKNLREEIKPGDLVRAKVWQIKKKKIIQLTTVGADFGVIFAYCQNCRTLLRKVGNRLKCPRCGNVEIRKMARDYGNPRLPPQVKEVIGWRSKS